MSHRSPRTPALTTFALLVALGLHATMALAANAPDPKAVEQEKAAAQNMRELAATTLGNAQHAGPTLKAAAKDLSDAYLALAKVKDQMAAALQSGDEKQIEELNAQWARANEVAAAQYARTTALTYAEQLTDSRPLDSWRMGTPKTAQPLLDAFLLARAAAASAWAQVANAAQAGAPPDQADVVKDKAILAGVESNIAQRLWTTGCDVARRTEEAQKLHKPELDKVIEDLKSLDQQAAKAMRQSVEAELLLRKIDRMRQAASEHADELEQPSPATKP